MTSKRSYDERIEELQERQKQLKAQEKALKAQRSKEERNKRTKRLIEVGAIVEKAVGVEFDSPEKKEKLQKILIKERSTSDGGTSSIAALIHSTTC